MKTVKKGRPPRKEKRHVIWLTTSTLRLWNERRKAFVLKNKSNSEFAEVLLHGMFLKRTGRFDCPDNNNNKGAQRTLVVGSPLRSFLSLWKRAVQSHQVPFTTLGKTSLRASSIVLWDCTANDDEDKYMCKDAIMQCSCRCRSLKGFHSCGFSRR